MAKYFSDQGGSWAVHNFYDKHLKDQFPFYVFNIYFHNVFLNVVKFVKFSAFFYLRDNFLIRIFSASFTVIFSVKGPQRDAHSSRRS